jgi:hypothetical protein
MEMRLSPVDPKEREAQEIVAWRREQLAASGFPPSLADLIARDDRYDLHELIELAERGCPPDLAARILAPLDEKASAV